MKTVTRVPGPSWTASSLMSNMVPSMIIHDIADGAGRDPFGCFHRVGRGWRFPFNQNMKVLANFWGDREKKFSCHLPAGDLNGLPE